MNRALRTLVAAVAGLAAAVPALSAPETRATIRLSWETCSPQVAHAQFTAATTYKLVVSAADFTPGYDADDHLGTELRLIVAADDAGALPDAWRFDDSGGCQSSAQIFYSSSALTKACPALRGGYPLPLTYCGYSPTDNRVLVLLANTYDDVSPQSGMRYTVWQVLFDMSLAVPGPSTPGATCGGAERPVRISFERAALATLRGEFVLFQTAPGDLDHATWNLTPPVAIVPATWGRLKGLYR